MEIEALADQLEFDGPVVGFDELRDQVEQLLDREQTDDLRLELEKALNDGASTRSGLENAWLYEQLGDAYRQQGRLEQAVEAYQQAFDLEPRDMDVALKLCELLTEQDRQEEALQAARLMLLNHKRELLDEEIAQLYAQMGQLYEQQDSFEQARMAYEKALVKQSDHREALTGLLRVVDEVGEPGDVVEARLKLIRGLEDVQERSEALVGLGEDWIDTFNDPGRALDTFEEALNTWPQNTEAIARIVDVAGELGDWRRVCRALFTLHLLADDPEDKAEYLIQSSDVAREKLWEPEKALAGYRKALQWDPTRLDAFTSITSILVDAQDWESLEEAYVQVISTNAEDPDTEDQLMAVLWEKLGDLYTGHLDRVDDAIFAYSQAVDYAPDRLDLRSHIVELAEERDDQLDEAAEQLRVLIDREPDNSDWIDRLGRVYLRRQEVDSAYCMFRALRAIRGRLDAKPAKFLERFEQHTARTIRGQINPSMMKRHIFAAGMSSTLNNCFSLLKQGLEKWVGESRRKLGLGWRDDVDMSEPLALVNFYKDIGAALGYVDLPTLWRKEDQKGLINGALAKGGLIVGDELLGSGRERYIAFMVAKQLFLYLDPFYLAAIRPLSDLKAFFLLAVALVRPETGLADKFGNQKTYKKAYKALSKNVKGEDLQELRRCVQELTRDGDEVDIGPWIESVEDSANRVGLLFCDSLEVARECLRDEPRTISERTVDQRMEALIDYSISDKYLSLRPQLGIEVA